MVRRRLRGSVWRCHLPEAAERAHCRPTRHVAEASRAVLVLGIPRLPRTTPASAQSDKSMASPVASSMMTPTVSDTSPMRPKEKSSMVTRMRPPVPQRMPATLAAGDCPWSQTVCVIRTSRWGEDKSRCRTAVDTWWNSLDGHGRLSPRICALGHVLSRNIPPETASGPPGAKDQQTRDDRDQQNPEGNDHVIGHVAARPLQGICPEGRREPLCASRAALSTSAHHSGEAVVNSRTAK